MSGENEGDFKVNIGYLEPHCSRSATEHLNYATYAVCDDFLVWFGTQDLVVY